MASGGYSSSRGEISSLAIVRDNSALDHSPRVRGAF